MTSFIIKKNATTWWPVKWQEPVDGGGVAECRIEMKFRRLSKDEAGTIVASDFEFIKLVATDWRLITDEADRPAPFDDANIMEMVARPAFVLALAEAFAAFTRALPETRQGNFDPSPDGGPAAGAKTADQADTATP